MKNFKWVLIEAIAMTMIIGCYFAPKYKVGDCFIDNQKELESWEKDTRYFHKVIQIGKNNYKLFVNQIGDDLVFTMTSSFYYSDLRTSKIECPESLKEN